MNSNAFIRILFLTTLLVGGGLTLRRVHVLDRALVRAAYEFRLDPEILSAVAWQETRYRPEAVGAAGEIGLLQVMPSTAADWAKAHNQQAPSAQDLHDPELNARVAAWYLRAGLNAYAGKSDPLPFALARYNAGPTRVASWVSENDSPDEFVQHIPYPGTKRYVENILKRMR